MVAFATPERLTPRESPAMGRNEGTLMTFIFPCDFLVVHVSCIQQHDVLAMVEYHF